MRNFNWFALSLSLVLFTSACSQNPESEGTTNTDVVQWEALSELDELAVHLEGYVEDNDLEHVRGHVEELQTTGQTVVEGPVPENVKNPEKVKQIQTDLKNVMDNMTNELISDDQMLSSLILSLHPIVENLMEAAGVPHVHEHDDEHDHDDEHGHDHDEAETSNKNNELEVH